MTTPHKGENSSGILRVLTKPINKPCEECGTTQYPNLQWVLVFGSLFVSPFSGVLCQACLNKVIESVNVALGKTSGE